MRAVFLRVVLPSLSLLGASNALAGDLTPPGAPGPTMKTLGEVEPRIPIGPLTTPGDASSTYRIDAPGSYYLTGETLGEVDKIGVLINASDVTLDLSGFTLRGQPTVSSVWPAVLVTTGNTNVEVRNGTIAEWAGNGVEFDSGGQFDQGDVKGVARDLRIRDCGGWGVLAEIDTIIENCRVTGCEDGGIQTTRSGAIVRGCIVTGNGIGLSLVGGSLVSDTIASSNSSTGLSAGDGAVVERVTARFNGVDGISIGIGGIARDCVAVGNTNNGFRLSGGASLFNCVSRSNSGDGYFDDAPAGLLKGSRLEGCVAASNGGSGFEMTDAASLTGCTAEDNGADGFTLGVNASVADCTATNNGQAGVLAGAGFAIRDSVISDNDSGIVSETALPNGEGEGAIIDRCVIRSNDTYGVLLEDPGTDNISQVSITNNTIEGNGQNGVLVERFALIVGNVIGINGGLGGVDNGGILVRQQGCRIEANSFTANAGVAVRLKSTRNIVVRNNFMQNNGNIENAFGISNKVGQISDDLTILGPWDNIAH